MVRPGHGAHSVGDDQHRLTGQQAGEGALHLGLVLHIQAGGGLVQQDDGAFFKSARAMEMRCRSPPESLRPFSDGVS